MKYTHILWDFNGTLLDDVGCGITCINTMLKKRGLPTIDSVEKYHSVFTFPITQYYENVGFDFEKEPFSKIAPEWIELNQINIKKAPLFDDAITVLEELKRKKISQAIISATKQDLLRGHIADIGITDYFDDISGLDNINAESKIGIAENWVKNNPEAKTVLIGDTVHDFEVSSAVNIDCLLVCRGHQSKQTLTKTGMPVFDTLTCVLEYLTTQ